MRASGHIAVHDSDGNMKTGYASTRESAVTLTPAPSRKIAGQGGKGRELHI
jgi:hypothetical protein